MCVVLAINTFLKAYKKQSKSKPGPDYMSYTILTLIYTIPRFDNEYSQTQLKGFQ